MRLTYAEPDLEFGAAEVSTLRLSRNLLDMGHEASAFALISCGSLRGGFDSAGVISGVFPGCRDHSPSRPGCTSMHPLLNAADLCHGRIPEASTVVRLAYVGPSCTGPSSGRLHGAHARAASSTGGIDAG